MKREWGGRAPHGSDPPRSGSSEQVTLVWERAGTKPVAFDLRDRDTFTIGRDASNAIVIASNFVSKAHAVLQRRDGHWLIEDQGSANGTRLNGAPVKVHAVAPGDVIEVGDQRLVLVDRSRRVPAPADGVPRGGAPSAGLGK